MLSTRAVHPTISCLMYRDFVIETALLVSNGTYASLIIDKLLEAVHAHLNKTSDPAKPHCKLRSTKGVVVV